MCCAMLASSRALRLRFLQERRVVGPLLVACCNRDSALVLRRGWARWTAARSIGRFTFVFAFCLHCCFAGCFAVTTMSLVPVCWLADTALGSTLRGGNEQAVRLRALAVGSVLCSLFSAISLSHLPSVAVSVGPALPCGHAESLLRLHLRRMLTGWRDGCGRCALSRYAHRCEEVIPAVSRGLRWLFLQERRDFSEIAMMSWHRGLAVDAAGIRAAAANSEGGNLPVCSCRLG
jgi:hypothetical protein